MWSKLQSTIPVLSIGCLSLELRFLLNCWIFKSAFSPEKLSKLFPRYSSSFALSITLIFTIRCAGKFTLVNSAFVIAILFLEFNCQHRLSNISPLCIDISGIISSTKSLIGISCLRVFLGSPFSRAIHFSRIMPGTAQSISCCRT